MSQYANVLKYLPEGLRDDSEIVREAVSKSGYALLYASERLRSRESDSCQDPESTPTPNTCRFSI